MVLLDARIKRDNTRIGLLGGIEGVGVMFHISFQTLRNEDARSM
jgi:hypothetical protein